MIYCCSRQIALIGIQGISLVDSGVGFGCDDAFLSDGGQNSYLYVVTHISYTHC